jgi:hypothetical protein
MEQNFGKILTYGWLRTFLDRHRSQVRRAVVHPQEYVRLQVSSCWLDSYIQFIKNYVPKIPAELIFNLDETGLSDWEERKEKVVLVPSAHIDSTLHYPVNRSVRHHTLMCCISAAGDGYCPLLIAPNRGAQKIFETGIHRDIGIMMEIREPAYATAEIFRIYIETVFFSAIAANRKLPGCRNKRAISFCDNCACQYSEDILIEFAGQGVLVLSYPPNMSNLFQVLDLPLFGRLKLAKKYLPRNDQASASIDHIIRIFKAYETVTTSTMARSCWEKARFEYAKMGQAFHLLVNDRNFRESTDFLEVWRINYPVYDLLSRRREQKWGYLNIDFFTAKYHGLLE